MLPSLQWFVFEADGFSLITKVQIVPLASESTATANLTANAPANTAAALKLYTLVNDDVASAAFMHPKIQLSPEATPPDGLFNRVREPAVMCSRCWQLDRHWRTGPHSVYRFLTESSPTVL